MLTSRSDWLPILRTLDAVFRRATTPAILHCAATPSALELTAAAPPVWYRTSLPSEIPPTASNPTPFALPYTLFARWVKTLQGDTVHFTVKDNTCLLRDGIDTHSRARLTLSIVPFTPDTPPTPSPHWTISLTTLDLDWLERVALAADHHSARGLDTVCFSIDQAKDAPALALVATNGHRLSHVTLPVPLSTVPPTLPHSSLLPRQAVAPILAELKRHQADEPIHISGCGGPDEPWITFSFSHSHLSAQCPTFTYPAFEQVLPRKPGAYHARLQRDDLLHATSLITTIAATPPPTMTLHPLSADSLQITCKDHLIGTGSDIIPAAISNMPTIKINGDYLLEVLRTHPDPHLVLEGMHPTSPLVIRGVETPHYTHLIMPMAETP